ncbi:MAG: hypothetical protein JXR84_03380 [Anaerolineae bacterium]|nr:hypothetical protein [Anaerolineae bacterium]
METSYYTNFVARSVVAERLNRSQREPVVLDRIQFPQIISVAVKAAVVGVQHFAKRVEMELRLLVDTQNACTWQQAALTNC